MKTIHFSFSTKLTFDDYVHSHTFALRVIPPESEVQHILSCDLNISPMTRTQQTVDAFGNHVTSGYISVEHRFLDFEMKGSAEIDFSKTKTDYMSCYLYQSDYTKPDADLQEFYETQKVNCLSTDIDERVAFFSEILSEQITYQKNVTTIKTTSAEAFKLKAGVCQDFSHLLLSLLRMDSIACRYIAGLAFCDGETHGMDGILDG